MARNRFYIVVASPPYEAGEWYDNVPTADYDALIASGRAWSVGDTPCGCRLAKGRAVALALVHGEYCIDHASSALRAANTDRKDVE